MSTGIQPSVQQKPKLLDRVRAAIRSRHYSPKEIDCKILQPSSAALMAPAMGRATYIQPVPAHPQNSDEGTRLQPLQPQRK